MTTEEKLQHFYDVSMESAREEAQKALEEYRRALDDMFEEHKKEKEKSAELRLKLKRKMQSVKLIKHYSKSSFTLNENCQRNSRS